MFTSAGNSAWLLDVQDVHAYGDPSKVWGHGDFGLRRRLLNAVTIGIHSKEEDNQKEGGKILQIAATSTRMEFNVITRSRRGKDEVPAESPPTRKSHIFAQYFLEVCRQSFKRRVQSPFPSHSQL